MSKLFNDYQSDPELQKWALYLNLVNAISSVDGEVSEDEVAFFKNYLNENSKNLTESKWETICKISDKIDPIDTAKKLQENEKIELLEFLTSVATSDGYFHSKELVWINFFSMLIGLDYERITELIFEKHKFDKDELRSAWSEMYEKLKDMETDLPDFETFMAEIYKNIKTEEKITNHQISPNKTSPEELEKNPHVTFCSQCGNSIDEEDNFCTNCGTEKEKL